MGDNLKKEQREEAIRRIELLSKRYNLKPEILENFKRGNVCCSEEIEEGEVTLVEDLNTRPQFAMMLKELEEKRNLIVYHCILYRGAILNLLYVSQYKEDWENDMPPEGEDYISAYTYVLVDNYEELGDIWIKGLDGKLIRTI